jgi:hypothetical protein
LASGRAHDQRAASLLPGHTLRKIGRIVVEGKTLAQCEKKMTHQDRLMQASAQPRRRRKGDGSAMSVSSSETNQITIDAQMSIEKGGHRFPWLIFAVQSQPLSAAKKKEWKPIQPGFVWPKRHTCDHCLACLSVGTLHLDCFGDGM